VARSSQILRSHVYTIPARQSFTKGRKVCNACSCQRLVHRSQGLQDSLFPGWTCCKPRVLTFDEFLSIPPCTTGKHSTVDETPAPKPKPAVDENDPPAPRPITRPNPPSSKASSSPLNPAAPPEPKEPEPEKNDPEDAVIPSGATCLRPACGQTYQGEDRPVDEQCNHHPGVPIFHEGAKGWSCCKKRVLAFDEFLELKGCSTTKKHLFIKPAIEKSTNTSDEEVVENVRNDYYQSSAQLTVSFFLKQVKPKGESSVKFDTSYMLKSFRRSQPGR
jgi:hypothetical protein